LRGRQPTHYQTQRSRHPPCRHNLTASDVLWLDPPALPQIQRAQYGAPPVDTGGLLMFLPGRSFLFPLICCSHSQGSHWALGCHHSRRSTRGKWPVSCTRPSTYRDISSQVFICLNLNGILLPFCPFCLQKTLIRFDSVRNFRSVRRCASLFLCVGSFGSLTPLEITDVPDSLDCCLDNSRD